MTLTEQKELQDYLLDAIGTIAKDAIANASFVKIEEGEVIEILDEALGTYKVLYLDNEITATSEYTTISYKVGDKVRLLLTNDKMEDIFILGSAVPSIDSYITARQEEYFTNSDNLLDGLSDIVEMSSYKKTTETLDYIAGNNFKTLFNQYFTENTNDDEVAYFSLEASLKTQIPTEQTYTNGNFGICLKLPTLRNNEETYHSFYLDKETLPGYYYSYGDYTYVRTIFSLDQYEIFDTNRLVSIYAFTDDNFIQDNGKPNDIFIREISLKHMLPYKENEYGYSFNLVSDDGPYFSENTAAYEKTIRPILRVNGKRTKVDNYDCYWFKENIDVSNSNHSKYNALGGVYWECLNDTSIGENKEIIIDKSKKTLSVLESDILSSCTYKCVMVVDNNALSSTITIKNLLSGVSLSVTSDPEILYPNSGNVTCKCEVNQTKSLGGGSFSYEWTRYNSKGENISVDNAKVSSLVYGTSEYELPVSFIDVMNTVKCTVYLIDRNGDKKLVGSEEKKLIVSKVGQLDFNLVIDNNDRLYKYDAAGNSPFLANYGGAPGSTPAVIPALGFKIFKKDGTEFTKEEYGICNVMWQIPKDSLFKIDPDLIRSEDDSYNYVTSLTLPYNIKPTYNAHSALSSIVLTVNFQEVKLTAKPNIIFTKDGANGTNGSRYVALITYNDFAYNQYDAMNQIDRKLKFVWKCSDAEGNGSWYLHDQENNILVPWDSVSESNRTLSVDVYDGDSIQTAGQVEVEWSMFDSSSTKPCFNIDKDTGILSLGTSNSWKNKDLIFCNTIQAKIKVGNVGVTDAVEYIYAYYPIEITRLGYSNQEVFMSDDASLIPHLARGYYEVDYSEDGKNPQYDTANSTFVCESIAMDDSGLKGYYQYDWTSSGNLTTEVRSSKECIFTPVSNYDNGISQNYVKVTVDAIKGFTPEEQSSAEAASIARIQQCDNYLDDLSDIKDTIEDWLDVFNTYYSNIDNYFTKCSQFVKLKGEAIDIIASIKKQFYEVVKPAFIAHTREYIADEYVLGDTFGDSYIYSQFQQRMNKLNQFNLTSTYDERAIQECLIAENIKNIEFESGFSTHLTPAGLAYYNKIRADFADYGDIYNFYVKTILQYEGGYVYEESYNNFRNYLSTVESIISGASILDYSSFILRDESNSTLKLFINDFNVAYNAIHNYFSGYFLTLNPTPSADERVFELKDYENYDYDYFTSKNKAMADYFYEFGSYEDISPEQPTTNVLNPKKTIREALQGFEDDYNSWKLDAENTLSSMETVFSNGSAAIIHIKPIIMVLNRYGNSYINGWDGNKLYIDEENGQYLFAPQVGAGMKKDGRFTGILLGGRGSNGITDETDIGLFGYHEGQQSIFLDSKKGSASFGKSGGGQIIIDPSQTDDQGKPKALITSGNYVEKDPDRGIAGSGMEIDLAAPAIRFGSENFSVDKDGNMITQTGYIGGWEIGTLDGKEHSVLHSPFFTRTLNGVELDGTDITEVIYLDSNAIRKDGEFVDDENAKPAIYTGAHKELNDVSEGFHLSSDGLSINEFFRVDNEKILFGNINLGNYWKVKYYNPENAYRDNPENRAYIAYKVEEFQGKKKHEDDYTEYMVSINPDYRPETGQVYLGTDGISLGGKNNYEASFWVSDEGVLFARKGYIGNWLIADSSLLGGKTKFNAHSEFRMELNAEHGYLSYSGMGIDGTPYKTPTNELDVFHDSDSYILNREGLYFGEWNTYLDNYESYFHSEYGDIGGFNFTGSTMETGYVPHDKRSYAFGGMVLKDGNEYWPHARSIPDNKQEIQSLEDLRHHFVPYKTRIVNNEEVPVNEFDHYMKIDPGNQCITFNAMDKADTSSYQGNGVYLGTDGIALGTTFEVSAYGRIKATSGNIAGWKLDDYTLYKEEHDTTDPNWTHGIWIDSEGSIRGGKYHVDSEGIIDDDDRWIIDESGYAVFHNVFIDGGELFIQNGNTYSFHVENNGHLSCTGVTINNGSINMNGDGNYIQIGDQDSASYFYASGRKVKCKKLIMDGGSITIKDGGGNINFKVTNEGQVSIYDGSITIKDADDEIFKLSTSGNKVITVKNNNKETFSLNRAGKVVCTDAVIGGVEFKDVAAGQPRTIVFPAGTTVQAPASNWGGWSINEGGISKGSTTLGTSGLTTGTVATSGNITASGSVSCNGITDSGTLTVSGTSTFNNTISANQGISIGAIGGISAGGAITGASLDVHSGSIKGGSLDVVGQVKGTSLDIGTGALKGGSLDVGIGTIKGGQTIVSSVTASGNIKGNSFTVGSQSLKDYIEWVIRNYVTSQWLQNTIGNTTYAPYSASGYATGNHTHGCSVQAPDGQWYSGNTTTPQ